ncbi:uncharacterized protein AMSG_03821 [Thecamonas trahens ATCC 50062]|uniref:Uncharacterized protein n=1 Tax=Thecamonas trahens ATCC 50062 TaxID=461836 RepID=A0A0L0D4U2_THETB|nr:hypothetical protein AMSG_03821 [Thecamonas trahens ATCC 50062]KNC47387.1 hypothetical protein AMSG_03821 [Thecamonas trahens ATCC 50062]|eukprot:XP_013759725.1 hypothetical protein AMSG_03821 [Thecamonas trahens ATCC 50062]
MMADNGVKSDGGKVPRPVWSKWPKTAHAHNAMKTALKSIRNAKSVTEAEQSGAVEAGTVVVDKALMENPALVFKAKIKLHGTNGGICGFRAMGDDRRPLAGSSIGIVGMSRNRFLWPDSQDNDGFRAWLTSPGVANFWADFFAALPACMGLADDSPPTAAAASTRQVEVFGEWAGDGIQKCATAVSNIDQQLFAIFALRFTLPDGKTVVVVEPNELEALVAAGAAATGAIPREIRVLPWHVPTAEVTDAVVVQLETSGSLTSTDELATARERLETGEFAINLSSFSAIRDAMVTISGLVNSIDEADPYIGAEFGVPGSGEGLVFYPVSTGRPAAGDVPAHISKGQLSMFLFKAKGASHRVTRAGAAAEFHAPVFETVAAFAEYFLTPARLYQGRAQVADNTFDAEHADDFVVWVVDDVIAESIDERDVNPQLDIGDIRAEVARIAAEWFAADGATIGGKKGKKGNKKRKKK